MAAIALSDLPGSVLLAVIQNTDGTWPNRPDATHHTLWIRIVAGSADPAGVTSPAVNGAYSYDPVVGPL